MYFFLFFLINYLGRARERRPLWPFLGLTPPGWPSQSMWKLAWEEALETKIPCYEYICELPTSRFVCYRAKTSLLGVPRVKNIYYARGNLNSGKKRVGDLETRVLVFYVFFYSQGNGIKVEVSLAFSEYLTLLDGGSVSSVPKGGWTCFISLVPSSSLI